MLKLPYTIHLNTALLMYQFNNDDLPDSFNDIFTLVSTTHNYRTRLACKSTFSLPQTRTNYGKLNIRFLSQKFRMALTNQLRVRVRVLCYISQFWHLYVSLVSKQC